MHGHVGRRLQAGVRVRRAALHLRRLRSIGRHRVRRREPVHRASHHVGAGAPQPPEPRHRGPRPAVHRDRDAGHAASAAAAEVGPDAALRDRGDPDRARLDRQRLRRGPYPRVRAVRRVRAAVHARPRRGRDRARAGRDRAAGRDDPRRGAGVLLVDHGGQPELPGGAHRAGHHQPGAPDRQHRAARHRRQLHHRAVQRHGLPAVQQHHQPAGRPRLRRPRRPREGRRGARHRPRRHSPRAELGLSRDRQGHPRGTDQGPLGHRDQYRALVDQPGPGPRHPRPARLSRRPGHVRVDGDRPDGGSRAPGGGLGREGRHLHQLGTAHRHDQEGGGGARRGAGRFRHLQAGGRVLGLRRSVSRVDVPRGGLPDSQAAVGGAALRHQRHRRLRDARRAGRHPVAVSGRPAAAGPRRGTAPVRGRAFLSCGRPRAVPLRRPAPAAGAAERAIPVPAPHRPRHRCAVAYPDAHREVGRPAEALSERGLRRDQPGRRAVARHPVARSRRGPVPARLHPGDRVRHPVRAARASVRAHALRSDQPAHRRRLRPLLQAAVLQGLRRRRGARPTRPAPSTWGPCSRGNTGMSDSARVPSPSRPETVVVIGNGMVGHRFCGSWSSSTPAADTAS